MRKVRTRTCGRLLGAAIVVAMAGAAAPPAAMAQDLTLHSKTAMPGRPSGTSTIYFGQNAMKQTSSDGHGVIVRLDQQKMILIDDGRKTYSEMTFEQAQQAGNRAMRGLDPQAAEQMRKMMGGDSPATVTDEGPGGQIAGYTTEKYELSMGPIQTEIWAAPEITVPGAYYEAMKALAPANPMIDMSKMYDEMKKVKGVALKTVMHMNMMGRDMAVTTEVTSIDKGPVPPSTFDIPEGYKKVPAPMVG
ncbi:MAG TPA: DUF4412 domain-containing protein [Vicinamibacterales bacterium]|nr:DUF4412 domain-containing protein [Vicinamibacterales bacterium]